jgi:DNA-binding NtrC family response regulator
MSVPITILLFGRSTRLLETRKIVLQSAGYRVYLASDLSAARHLLREKEIDLLILCRSLPMEDSGRALALTYRWPMMRSLVLTAGDDGCRDNLLSEVRDAVGGLAELVSTAGKFFHVESQTDAHVR